MIGFVGLGVMGEQMAGLLHKNGLNLSVFNRTKSKADVFEKMGVKSYKNLVELAKNCDTILLMLSDFNACLDVLNDEILPLLNGKTIINFSTISSKQSQKLDEILQANKAKFIESPVSGSIGAAKSGSLLILRASNNANLSDYDEIFNILSAKTIDFDRVGKASGAKLVLNSLLGILTNAYSEAFKLGLSFDLNLEQIANIIANSGMTSPLFNAKKELFTTQNFTPAFALKLMSKDLNLAIDEANNANLELEILKATAKNYQNGVKSGLGDFDMSAIFKQIN